MRSFGGLAHILLFRSAQSKLPISGLRNRRAALTAMPIYHCHFEPGQLKFITTSTSAARAVFADFRYGQHFTQAVQAARCNFQFKLIGWVLMPEPFHLLLRPAGRGIDFGDS